jgi:5-methylcytosine-specific restriction endonuclease McrA
MQLRTLVLMPWMTEINRVTNWKNGVVLAVTSKADVLEEYDVECSSPSLRIQIPAVLRLRKNEMRRTKKSVKFSRQNVYARDRYRCCYCGLTKTAKELNYDHVIPRLRGGKTVWENIVTSCYGCNGRKGSRTPAEAGLTMHYRPYRPTVLPLTPPVAIDLSTAPALWLPYLSIMQTQSA